MINKDDFCWIDSISLNEFPYLQEISSMINIINNFNEISICCGIITFNEERCIYRCLSSIYNYVDEIIIIDNHSTDNTLKIINEKFPKVKVLSYKWNNDFSYMRNKILKNCKSDWILFLDADEYMDSSSQKILKPLIYSIDKLLNEYKEITISPIIKNTNGFKYSDTRRIFNVKSTLKYYGKIHEEVLNKDKFKVPNIITKLLIHHDGYEHNIILSKNKLKRNLFLIQQSLYDEPNNPKWYFYYARDLNLWSNIGDFTTSEKDYINKLVLNNLSKSIILFDKKHFNMLYCNALVLICNIYLNNLNFHKVKYYLNIIKRNFPNCSDIIYFEYILKYNLLMEDLHKLHTLLINEDISNKFSFLYSSNEHLKLIEAKILLSLGEYESGLYLLNNINNISSDLLIKLKQIFKNL